jgi:hypothetical protein
MSEDNKEPEPTDEEIKEDLDAEAYLKQQEEEEGKWAVYFEAHPDEFLEENPETEPEKPVYETGSRPRLADVYRAYQKWFYVEDTKRIDISLAVLVNQRLRGLPLWIFFVGKSGDWKSTHLRTCEVDNTFRLHKLTSRTLVSGRANKNGEDKRKEFVEKLWGKVIIILDLAEIMSKNPTERGEIYAQLRDFYDGTVGGSYGTGVDTDLRGKPPQMLIGCTYALYDEYLIHEALGTRELMYRVGSDSIKARMRAKELAKSGMLNTAIEECRQVVQDFIRARHPMVEFEVPEDVDNEIDRLTDELVIFRAKARTDQQTGELMSDPVMELPTRAPMQLIQLYKALSYLDENYPKERALDIIRHVVESSGDPLTTKLYKMLVEKSPQPMTTNEIGKEMRLGYKTVYGRLNLLWALGKIELTMMEDGEKKTRMWSVEKADALKTPPRPEERW